MKQKNINEMDCTPLAHINHNAFVRLNNVQSNNKWRIPI